MALIELSYLLAAALFIVGLKKLSSPATARRGNLLSSIGMLVAVAATVLAPDPEAPGSHMVKKDALWIVVLGVAVGSAVGGVLALRVKMTAMPQMVALLNGFGGGASALVAVAEFSRNLLTPGETIPVETGIAIQLGVVVGAVTLSGSIVAFGKLQELISGRPLTYPLQKVGNGLLVLLLVAAMIFLVQDPLHPRIFVLLCVGALVFGVLFVVPIGGADMPVVISLLNSFSGIAASIAGFVILNSALIICGALVGASGLILTQIMCRAMNRSLLNVLFGAFGGGAGPAGKLGEDDRSVNAISHEDGAVLLGYAQLIVVAPGYGLAVAQAQHQVRELMQLLEKRDVEVKFAIHPVAGRMPGHMNVLLAESDVPYTQLYDMDQINPEFERADVALVIGANDVVNPAARSDTSSPIYGMPILDVDKAQNVIVMKRSMNPGFAGIQNELFFHPKTKMLFGDAKESLLKLISEIEEL